MMENIPNNLRENAEFPHSSPPQSETAHDGGRPSENGVGGVSDNKPGNISPTVRIPMQPNLRPKRSPLKKANAKNATPNAASAK